MPYGSAQTSMTAGARAPAAWPGARSDVPDEDARSRARQDAAVNEVGGNPRTPRQQGVNQQQLDEIVDGEAEEPVDVSADDPAHSRGSIPRGSGIGDRRGSGS